MTPRESTPPPHSLEAEQAVLGSCLMDAGAARRVHALGKALHPDGVDRKTRQTIPGWPQVFYAERHRLIGEQIHAALEAGEPVDLLNVWERLRLAGHADATGGRGYLAALPPQANPPSAEHQLKIVDEHFRRREIITKARDAINAAISRQERVGEICDDLIHWFQVIRGSSADLTTVSLNTAEGQDWLRDEIEAMKRGDDYIPCFLESFNRHTGGFPVRGLTVLYGESGLGKTEFAFLCAFHAAKYFRDTNPLHHVVYLSVEDSRFKLVKRLVSAQRLVCRSKWKHPGAEEIAAMEYAAEHIITKLPMALVESAAPTMSEIDAEIDKLVQRGLNPRFIVLDYGQRIFTGVSKIDDAAHDYARHNRVVAWAQRLIKKTGCAMLLVSQAAAGHKSIDEMLESLNASFAKGRGSNEFFISADLPVVLFRESWSDNSLNEDRKQDRLNPFCVEPAKVVIKPKRETEFGMIDVDRCGMFGLWDEYGTLDSKIRVQLKNQEFERRLAADTE